MEKRRETRLSWLEAATRGIRFKPDREAVARELSEHLEDKTADLRRIFPNMSLPEAEQRALGEMGDPEEVGRELARIHKPWLGYLWRASRAILVLVLILAAFGWGSWGLEEIRYWREYGQEVGYGTYVDDAYLSGKNPFTPENPHYKEEWEGLTDLVRTPLKVWQPREESRVGQYRFRLERAALWSFRREGEQERMWLFCELQVDQLPWQPLHWEAAQRITATDSLGNRYYSTYETHELRLEPEGEDGGVLVNGLDGGPLRYSFELQLSDMEPGAEWIRFELDRGGPVWSCTLWLTEVGG